MSISEYGEDAAVRAGTFALATPGALPSWMQMAALGRNMTPVAKLVVEAAEPIIAARVRDEVVTEQAQLDRIDGGPDIAELRRWASQTPNRFARDAVFAAADAVERAERMAVQAVAAERQRIVALASGMCTARDRLGRSLPDPHPADHLGPCPYGQVVQRILAGGSVPVATPAEPA